MKINSLLFLTAAVVFSCRQPNSTHPQPSDATAGQKAAGDSVEVLSVLKNVYRWHANNQSPVDFMVTVQDSVQTGLNDDSFRLSFRVIRQTNYFSASFLDNYKKIADSVNTRLTRANPKYLNEINFSFQDADPWTHFQDEAPAFWDSLIISDYRSTADSASLKWKIKEKDWSSESYAVRFLKENGQWKVAYLEGFDLAECFK